jgi:hypothetical protein
MKSVVNPPPYPDSVVPRGGGRFSRGGAEAQRWALSGVGIPCVPASLREVPVGRWRAVGTVFPQGRRGAGEALSGVGIPCVPASLREVPVGRWRAVGDGFPAGAQRRRGGVVWGGYSLRPSASAGGSRREVARGGDGFPAGAQRRRGGVVWGGWSLRPSVSAGGSRREVARGGTDFPQGRRGAEEALSGVGIPCVPASLREVPVGRWRVVGGRFSRRGAEAQRGRCLGWVFPASQRLCGRFPSGGGARWGRISRRGAEAQGGRRTASHRFYRLEAVRQSLSFHPTRDLKTAARRGLCSPSICEIREICG